MTNVTSAAVGAGVVLLINFIRKKIGPKPFLDIRQYTEIQTYQGTVEDVTTTVTLKNTGDAKMERLRLIILVNSAYVPIYSGNKSFICQDYLSEGGIKKIAIFGNHVKIGESINIKLTIFDIPELNKSKIKTIEIQKPITESRYKINKEVVNTYDTWRGEEG